jgi:hypothetical protein
MNTKELVDSIGMSKTDISKAIADSKNMKSYRSVLNWSNDRIFNEYNQYVIGTQQQQQQQPVMEQQQQQQPVQHNKPLQEGDIKEVNGQQFLYTNGTLVPIASNQPVRNTQQQQTEQQPVPKYHLINGYSRHTPVGEAIEELNDNYELVAYGMPKPDGEPSSFIVVMEKDTGFYRTVFLNVSIASGRVVAGVGKTRFTRDELLQKLSGSTRKGEPYLKADYRKYLNSALPKSR